MTERKLQAADLFCGGGGFTTGAQQSGRVDVVLAVNHWRTAIYTHQHNHPETRHICARIDDVDPRNDRTLPELDLLLASPECTHHSIARGGRNPGATRGCDETVPTIVASQANHSIVVPFLTKFYGTGGSQSVDDPVDTITSHDRFGLAMASLIQTMRELHIVDIGFRMLEPDELSRAQGFPDGYWYHGTRAEQVRQIGNAVCPPVAKALCQTIAEAA